MIVVLAHPADGSAVDLVGRWSRHDARLLTSADLSVRGWVSGMDTNQAAMAVVDGQRIDEAEIRGVLVRTPAVGPAELARVVDSDRRYCAAEMTAFLRWWLARLPVPVVNRPTASSLAGPGWHPAAWARQARSLGLAVTPLRLAAGGQDHPSHGHRPARSATTTVTVVGGRCIGSVPGAVGAAACTLAAAARAAALNVTFDLAGDEPRFLAADPFVDVTHEGVAAALLHHLLKPCAQRSLV